MVIKPRPSKGGFKVSNVAERRKAGVYLKQCREVVGLTQREIAAKCGFEYYTFVSQLEGGHGRLPVDHWETYAKAVGQDPQDFATRLFECYEPVISKLVLSKKDKPC